MKNKSAKILSFKNITMALLTICALISLFAFCIAKFYLSSYNLLMERELVAVVECDKNPDSNKPILNVEFFSKAKPYKKQTFGFNADEWVIEGRIVKWKPLLGLFGVQRYYKLERLGGRYIDIEKEKSMPRLVYDLSSNPDKFWLFMYKYQKLLPFVDAVYGNSAFIQYASGTKYHVYMTSTGFMIKDVTVKKKRSWWFTG